MELQIYTGSKGEHHWRLKHENGNNMANGGEGYQNKTDILKAIDTIENFFVEQFLGQFTENIVVVGHQNVFTREEAKSIFTKFHAVAKELKKNITFTRFEIEGITEVGQLQELLREAQMQRREIMESPEIARINELEQQLNQTNLRLATVQGIVQKSRSENVSAADLLVEISKNLQ